eukprot:jgi/Tetstr1/446109/TSEL_033709.t1
MALEDASLHDRDICVMYTDCKGAINAADHRIMFKHMEKMGIPSGVCAGARDPTRFGLHISHYGATQLIPVDRGTLQGDILWPFMFTLFFEPLLRWSAVGSRGYQVEVSKYDENMPDITVDDVMGVGEDPVGEDGMDIDAPAWPPAGVEPAMRA